VSLLEIPGTLKGSAMQVSTFMSRRLVALVGAVAVALAAGGLTACGGGGSGTAKTADGTTNITVLRSTGSTFEPLYIAQDQGFFKDEGLNVTIKEGAQDTSQNAPSVINGEAQLAMTDSSGFIKGAASGLPIQIVADLQASTTSAPPSDGLIVAKNSPIKSFADVGGKTIALPALGGTLEFICDYSAEQAGVDPSTIKYVSLPLTSLNDAVQKGQVDAAYVFATFLDAAKASGMRAIGVGTNALPGLPQALLFANTSWLKGNADTAKKFVAAVTKAVDYANKNPGAVRAVDTKYTQLPADYIKGRTIQPFYAGIDTSSLGTVVTDMKKYGLIDTEPETSTMLWSGAPTETIK
jgi:NitT/TauT family transport system substrate-binding protein